MKIYKGKWVLTLKSTTIKAFERNSLVYGCRKSFNNTCHTKIRPGKINTWARQWLVTFNPNKSETVLISRKRNRQNHPHHSYEPSTYYQCRLSSASRCLFSANGSWPDHVNYITSKVSPILIRLLSLKFKRERNTLRTIYLSFIRPIMEYGDIIWGNIPHELVKKLKNLNIEAARIITGATKLVSIDKLFIESTWVSLFDRRQVHKIIHFHKMFYHYIHLNTSIA